MVSHLSTRAKPKDALVPNQDWHAESFANAKVVSHVVTHGLQKLLLVTRILKKKKMNGLNKI